MATVLIGANMLINQPTNSNSGSQQAVVSLFSQRGLRIRKLLFHPLRQFATSCTNWVYAVFLCQASAFIRSCIKIEGKLQTAPIHRCMRMAYLNLFWVPDESTLYLATLAEDEDGSTNQDVVSEERCCFDRGRMEGDCPDPRIFLILDMLLHASCN